MVARRRETGVTLLELLLANLILGLILTVAYGLYAQGLSLRTRASAEVMWTGEWQTLFERLRRELAQAVMLPTLPPFTGEARKLAFWTQSGDKLVQVEWQWDEETAQLLHRQRPYGAAAAAASEQILSTHVAAFSLRYLKNNNSWVEYWNEAELPRGVELRCSLITGKQKRHFPPLFLPIPVGQIKGEG